VLKFGLFIDLLYWVLVQPRKKQQEQFTELATMHMYIHLCEKTVTPILVCCTVKIFDNYAFNI